MARSLGFQAELFSGSLGPFMGVMGLVVAGRFKRPTLLYGARFLRMDTVWGWAQRQNGRRWPGGRRLGERKETENKNRDVAARSLRVSLLDGWVDGWMDG